MVMFVVAGAQKSDYGDLNALVKKTQKQAGRAMRRRGVVRPAHFRLPQIKKPPQRRMLFRESRAGWIPTAQFLVGYSSLVLGL